MKTTVICKLTAECSFWEQLKCDLNGALEDIWLLQALQVTYFGFSTEKSLVPCLKSVEELKSSLEEEDAEAYYITSKPFCMECETTHGVHVSLQVKIQVDKFREVLATWISSNVIGCDSLTEDAFALLLNRKFATQAELPAWLEVLDYVETGPNVEEKITLSDLKVGDKLFDLYQIDAEIGSGGMGKVYLATDTKSALDSTRRVVLKVLHSQLVNQIGSQERIVKEAKILMRLNHENIARCLNCRLHGQTPVMIMEYIEGVTLQDYLKGLEKPLSEVETQTLLRPIAQAIDYAHKCKVYHLDLKPANIMVRTTADGCKEAILLDFSISKLLQSDVTMTMMNVNAGTRPYMSPQQLMGQEVSRSMDIYSLAVTAYQCLTGRLPYPNGYSERHTIEPLFGNSPFVLSIMSGLNASEEKRPRSCIDLIDPQDNAERGQVIESDNEIFKVEDSLDDTFSDLERKIFRQFQILLVKCADNEELPRRKTWLKGRISRLYDLVQADSLDGREELITFFDEIRAERKRLKESADKFFTATVFLRNLCATLPKSGSRVLKSVFLCVND